ncbi:MAG: radical SAM protein [Halothiobacillaceae bacterium]|nr:radical SAM protein [Halothiobacillaceae bacterium]
MSTPAPLTFGPIPSRRLGASLGVNNIPYKQCSYSCVYCQLGPTQAASIGRREFYSPQCLRDAVAERLEALSRKAVAVDWLSFVPDGEPTLDANLGVAIEALKPLGVPVAVFTNASRLSLPEVREALMRADCVSVKVDAVEEGAWRAINRPHPQLVLAEILDGARAFAASYRGRLLTETMLVAGINDGEALLRANAAFIARLTPAVAYLATPTRPTAEGWAHPVDEACMARAYAMYSERLPQVECLSGYEGNAFGVTGDAETDLLGIMAVHPMRREGIEAVLAQSGADWTRVEALLARGELIESPFEGRTYYVRRFAREG